MIPPWGTSRRRRPRHRTPEVPDLHHVERELGVRPGGREQPVQGDLVQVGQEAGRLHHRHRVDRLRGDVAELPQRHVAHGVHDERRDAAQRLEHGREVGLLAEEGEVHRHEGLAADGLGELGHRREPEELRPHAQRLRGRQGRRTVGVQHRVGHLDRPHHPAPDHRRRLGEPQLHRGDDGEVPATTAHGPEQVRVRGRPSPGGACRRRRRSRRPRRARPRSRCERLNQLRPPPRVKPTTLGSGLLPAGAMSPVGSTAASRAPHFTPAPTRATRRSASTSISCRAPVRSRTVPVRASVAPWPTGWAETLSPWRAAQVTAATTSSTPRTATTAAGSGDVDDPAEAGAAPGGVLGTGHLAGQQGVQLGERGARVGHGRRTACLVGDRAGELVGVMTVSVMVGPFVRAGGRGRARGASRGCAAGQATGTAGVAVCRMLRSLGRARLIPARAGGLDRRALGPESPDPGGLTSSSSGARRLRFTCD